MTVQCSLEPSGKKFPVQPNETILQAALRAGVVLPYGCKDGACGSCKSQLLEGEVDYGNYQKKALSDDERAQGSVLICCWILMPANLLYSAGMAPTRSSRSSRSFRMS